MSFGKWGFAGVVLVFPVLVVAGCGGLDTTPAAESLSEQYTSELQTGLVQELGFAPAEVEGAAITVSCPESVTEGETFDCTVSGTPGGESRDVEVEVVGDDTIDFVNESVARTAVDEVFTSVATALGA